MQTDYLVICPFPNTHITSPRCSSPLLCPIKRSGLHLAGGRFPKDSSLMTTPQSRLIWRSSHVSILFIGDRQQVFPFFSLISKHHSSLRAEIFRIPSSTCASLPLSWCYLRIHGRSFRPSFWVKPFCKSFFFSARPGGTHEATLLKTSCTFSASLESFSIQSAFFPFHLTFSFGARPPVRTPKFGKHPSS